MRRPSKRGCQLLVPVGTCWRKLMLFYIFLTELSLLTVVLHFFWNCKLLLCASGSWFILCLISLSELLQAQAQALDFLALIF